REFRRLQELAVDAENVQLSQRIDCHLAYLEALIGERSTLGEYIRRTQGCGSAGWSPEYVAWRGEEARKALESRGISWGSETWRDLQRSEQHLTSEEIGDAIRGAAKLYEPVVREATGATAEYHLVVETADVDAYWEYWLDGVGEHARLRLNMRKASFTDVQ